MGVIQFETVRKRKERKANMKIGQLVKLHIKKILYYCDTYDHGELPRLMDPAYSKETFGINFPFCTEVSEIPTEQSMRYWTTSYFVRGKTVRVSSQWFDKNKVSFIQYLLKKKIVTKDELSSDISLDPGKEVKKRKKTRSSFFNSRYKGNAIGNAQNLVVRNILSNLGQESFNKQDWEETKAYFSNQCAYCGGEGDLLMEHIIPINRQALGEHRLGNLAPSCRSCNSTKADKDFREFLDGDPDRIQKIEDYMESRNYVPLGDNEQVGMVLEMAYKEISSVAQRYISILNELFPK